jgi:hypothetical protein
MNPLRRTCLGLFAASLLVGCTSTDKSATTPKPAPSNAEYTRETPTGSWITKKVKKTPTSETETDQAKQALEELQRRGNRTPKESGG